MKHILNDKTLHRFVKYGTHIFHIDEKLPPYEIASLAIQKTYDFFSLINIPMHLKDVGIDETRLQEMAHHIAINEGLENAWAPLSEEDILAILKESL